MKKLIFCICLIFSNFSFADTAIVVRKKFGCDYFVAYSKSGYYLLEWFGGWDPDKDDIVVGAINSYGIKNVKYTNIGNSGKVWVEDFWLTREDAFEKLLELCD